MSGRYAHNKRKPHYAVAALLLCATALSGPALADSALDALKARLEKAERENLALKAEKVERENLAIKAEEIERENQRLRLESKARMTKGAVVSTSTPDSRTVLRPVSPPRSAGHPEKARLAAQQKNFSEIRKSMAETPADLSDADKVALRSQDTHLTEYVGRLVNDFSPRTGDVVFGDDTAFVHGRADAPPVVAVRD
jgi:hypothetical protein